MHIDNMVLDHPLEITENTQITIGGILSPGPDFPENSPFIRIHGSVTVNISGGGRIEDTRKNLKLKLKKKNPVGLIVVSGDSQLNISNLSLVNSRGHGIQVINSTLIGQNLVLSKNTGNGIQLQRASYAELSEINSSQNKSGIVISKSSAKLQNINVEHNKNHGIAILHSYNVNIDSIEAHHNGAMGVTFGGSKLDNEVQNTNWIVSNLKASHNAKNGISIDPTSSKYPDKKWAQQGRLENIKAWRNQGHGVYVTHSSEIDALNVSTWANAKSGIAIANSSKTSWKECIAEKNKKHGVAVYGQDETSTSHSFNTCAAKNNIRSDTHLGKKLKKTDLFINVNQ